MLIGAMYYGMERRAKKLTDEERLAMRQQESLPLLDNVFDWCQQHQEKYLPKAPLYLTCQYALNHETALRVYCTDGQLAVDNNKTERMCDSPPSVAKTGSSSTVPTAAKPAAFSTPSLVVQGGTDSMSTSTSSVSSTCHPKSNSSPTAGIRENRKTCLQKEPAYNDLSNHAGRGTITFDGGGSLGICVFPK